MNQLSDILNRYGEDYLKKYSPLMPKNHLKAIRDIRHCRTAYLGGQAYICNDCKQFHYSYHSCRNRNCNKCQNDRAKSWFQKSKELLLPVTHFMVTFTLHSALRDLARSNQKLFYNLLFKASSGSLQKLAYDSKYVGGKLAMMGVLHTWSRALAYHPHIHFIVPGGGFFQDANIWLHSSDKFLVPVLALSKIFRASFQAALKKADPALYNSISKDIWNQNWVVHSKPVGKGEHALKYLSQYIFRPAISNSRIISIDNNKVIFNYRDSKTHLQKTICLSSEEFIRRYLTHVLPSGFVKVRYYGLFSFTNKKLLLEIKDMLSQKNKSTMKPKETSAEQPKLKPDRQVLCPSCGKPMIMFSSIPKGSVDNKAPPGLIMKNLCS